MIQNTEYAPQGSAAWRLQRLGHLTASKFGELFPPTGKPKKEWTQSAETYLVSLIGEHLTGQPMDDCDSKATRWGNDHEAEAREALCWSVGVAITTTGFWTLDEEEWIGGSPDGLANGLISEIKSPWTTKEHVRVLWSRRIPPEHTAQVQGNLWITGREKCLFASYDPRMLDRRHQLCVVEVPRDDVYIEALAERVIAARDKMLERLESLRTSNVPEVVNA